MMELGTRLFVSLLVFLAAAPEASPQTVLSGPPSSQAAVRKTGKAGNGRASPARNSIAETSPVLRFQPGVGWQRIPTGQPNGSSTRDARGPAGAVNPASVDAKSMSAKQAGPGESAGILSDKKRLGAVETTAILSPNRAIRSAGSTKLGAVTSLQVTPFHPNGSTGMNSMRTTPSAMPSAPTHFASKDGPDEHSDLVGERAFHAYISPIKLRRLIRNAPDFRTRMKLEQLQNNPATKLHHARVDTKRGQLASNPPQGEHVRVTSLRTSDANARPRRNPRE
jgi:hypothetical protein